MLYLVILLLFIQPCWQLEAWVAATFPAPAAEGAPAIVSFTTSSQDFYRRFHVELRVVFLPEEQPVSFIPQVETCHDVIAEASEFFPAPLSCYGSSGNASSVNGTVLFGIRFGMLQTLQPGSTYRFVLPGLTFNAVGTAQWRLEFWVDGSELIESAVASVPTQPSLASVTGNDASLVEAFLVRGGSSMTPDQEQSLLLSIRLNASYALPAASPGQVVRFAVTLFPLLLWDQKTPACTLEESSISVSCEFMRLLPNPSYNVLSLAVDAQLLTQVLDEARREASEVNAFNFRVRVLAPDQFGFLPSELMLSVLAEDWAFGPFFQVDLTSQTVESLEMSCRVSPYPTVQLTSSNRLEGTSGSVVLRFVPGATLRGLSLRNEPRDVNVSITAAPFFVFTGASNVPDTFALGTDRAPAVFIDKRSIVFALGGQRSLALGHVEYAVQLEMLNPTRYFWQISREEPWRLALIQGPRPNCRACTRTRFETSFTGPEIQFEIFDFQVIPSSLQVAASTSVVFTFRLLNAAEQLQLFLPSGTTASSCSFVAPSDVAQEELQCVTDGSSSVGVIRRGLSNGTAQEILPLFMGLRLSFRVEVVHPAVVFADSRGGVWYVQALDAVGEVVGRLQEQGEVQLPLYVNVIPHFAVTIEDARAGIVAAVQVAFRSGRSLEPGDFIQVTNPPDFFWNFVAADFELRLPFGVDADLPVQVQVATGRVLRLKVTSSLQQSLNYGFRANVQTPSQPPPEYCWTFESYGPGAETGLGDRYETGSLKAFELHLLTEARISPWTSVRGALGPLTVSFRTYQAVSAGGQLLIRSPADFKFQEPCFISELQFGEALIGLAVRPIQASAVRCKVLSSREAQLLLLPRPAGADDATMEGLDAGQHYSFTLHSVENPLEQTFEVLRLNVWELETRNENLENLDGPSRMLGLRVGDRLPLAVLLDGGPSTGEDLRSGERQWITVAFQVSVPSRTGQVMQLVAEEGSHFEAVCGVRDPPGSFAAPLGAIFIAQQIPQCSGKAHLAKLQVGAVWEPGVVLAFQIQVRNPVPLRGSSTDPMQSWREAWRLCLGVFNEGGCEQMRSLNESTGRPVGLQDFGVTTSSRAYGLFSSLFVHFGLFISMPPAGKVTLSAPSGYSFPLVCLDFTGQQAGYDAMPPRTSCKGGDLGRLLSLRQLSVPLQASDVQLTLGPGEEDRLLAYRRYAFALSVQNPGRLSPPMTTIWELRTFTGDGELLERSQTVPPDGGQLLLPLEGVLYPGSTFAFQVHSVRLVFRVLSSAEGGDDDIVSSLDQLDIFAPGEEVYLWDLSNPDACTTAFQLQDGGPASGLVHRNITSVFGELSCLVVNQGQLRLTFSPSVLTTSRTASVEFVVLNGQNAPEELKNFWLLRLSAASVSKCEAPLRGFSVTPPFTSIRLQTSSTAAGETCQVDFWLVAADVIQLGMLVEVLLPSGFQRLMEQEHQQAVESAFLEPLPLDAGSPLQIRLLVAATQGNEVHFKMGLVNTNSPGGAPRWTLQLLSSSDPGANVVARSSNFESYGVYYNLEVAGLYGSVREVGYKYNFVRLTFRLPEAATAMSSGGTLLVLAPDLFVLDPLSFSRENLPPQSVALSDGQLELNKLNISLVYPLTLGQFYAFSFSVTNPSVADGMEDLYWEMWCYELDGRVVSANTRIPPFKLEAFFQLVEVSPSSVIPLRSANEVEIQVVLGSTPLVMSEMGTCSLVIQLPSGFSVDPAAQGESRPWCQLGIDTFDVRKVQSQGGFVPRPLPSSSRCRLGQRGTVLIEVFETLPVDVAYHFQLKLSNPVTVEGLNTWALSTQREEANLHLAMGISNFQLYSLAEVSLFSSDVRQNLTQLILVQLYPPVHIMGFAQLQLRGPSDFQLSCSERGQTAPRGSLPLETECSLIGSALQMKLPEPVLYAPYQPQLLAGEAYVFGFYCINPAQSPVSSYFELQLFGAVATASSRLLGMQPFLPAPQLALPLAYLEVTADQVAPAGQMTVVTVRFQAPRGTDAQPVRALALEVAPGFRVSDGGACMSFGSQLLAASDTVLPPSTCAPTSERRVSLAMPQPLVLRDNDGLGRIYVFQIGIVSPQEQVLVDLILLSLLPSALGAPLYASSAVGFAAQIADLAPSAAVLMPRAQRVPEPVDSVLGPLSTVNLVSSGKVLVPAWWPLLLWFAG